MTTIVLLSGGLDSATALAWAQTTDPDCQALSFEYGQRHKVEIEAAIRVAASREVEHHCIVQIDPSLFTGSALTDVAVPVPLADQPGIPVTYVPARNTIFLSYALALAETSSAERIVIGANAVDYSGYPDCRPEYLAAYQAMARLALLRPVEIAAPLVHLTKAEIIELGLRLGVDYSLTHSCYNPVDGRPCRRCDSCAIRARGWAAVGQKDPAL